MFNVFNNQNLLAGGYIDLVGNPRFGEHTGGSQRLPGPAVPVRGDVSVLSQGEATGHERHLLKKHEHKTSRGSASLVAVFYSRESA